MRFDWAEFLGVARLLINEDSFPVTDAKDRSAVSRAYYAAFHLARRHVEENHSGAQIGSGGDMHPGLPKWLATQGAALAEIGVYLDRMRKHRKAADYTDPDIAGLHSIAYDCVRNCEGVIRILESI